MRFFKAIFLLFSLFAISFTASAWSGMGHRTVATVAEKYLSKPTKLYLDKYLDGQTIVDVASLPDINRRDTSWFRDLGTEISNPKLLWPGQDSETVADILKSYGYTGTRFEPWCHSFTVVADGFKPLHYNIADGKYVRNCVVELEYIANELKAHHKDMDEFTRMKYISLVTHLVGDMHCPMHILYEPMAATGGKNRLMIGDKSVNLHSFWDYNVFAYLGKDWSEADFARIADTATKKQCEEIVKGDMYDWAHESAKDCWQCQFYDGHLMDKYQKVSGDYAIQMSELLYQQLRNAGYRLAVLLNWIFEPVAEDAVATLYLPKSKVKAEAVPELLKSKHVEYMSISKVNWPKYSYCPDTKVAVAACKDAILLHFVVNEEAVRATYVNDSEAVYEDSCVEFFCSLPGEDNYYNFEFNCIGTALVATGPGRYDRINAPGEVFSSIDRWASLGRTAFHLIETPTHWELALVIPYTAFFQSDISSLEGKSIRANFFKCGNKLPAKHYVTFFPINSEKVNFHAPQFFGEIEFVRK